MHIGHEKISTSDARDTATVFGAAADGDALAKYIGISGDELGTLPGKLEVLRVAAHGTKRMENIFAAESRRPVYHSVRMQFATLTQLDVFANHRKSSDVYAIAQANFGRHDSVGMNFVH
jgi:hypothetical protein